MARDELSFLEFLQGFRRGELVAEADEQLGDWRRVEYQRRAHFAEIATAASDETGRPVFFGRTS